MNLIIRNWLVGIIDKHFLVFFPVVTGYFSPQLLGRRHQHLPLLPENIQMPLSFVLLQEDGEVERVGGEGSVAVMTHADGVINAPPY